MVKHQGTAEFECPRCLLVAEGKNGQIMRCPKCDTLMIKLFGGRANTGGHDLRHQDK